MWENASEIIIGISFAIVIVTWTVLRYFANTKGEYRRSFRGFLKELLNNVLWLGRNDVKYPEKDKLPPE